jgi:cytochrome P450
VAELATTEELDGLLLEVFATAPGRQNPYPRYDRLRQAAPVHRSSLGIVVCTAFEDCQFVLRDPRFGKGNEDADGRPRARPIEAKLSSSEREELRRRRSLLFLDPPDHTRLRSLVSRAFTPRTVEGLRPEIEHLVHRLLDTIEPGAPVDLLTSLALPLPVAVIGKLLGVPEQQWDGFQELMHHLVRLLEPFIPEEDLSTAFSAQQRLDTYFRSLILERRISPTDDLFSRLLAAKDGADALSEDELVSTAILLFGAGFETTTNLIGNAVLALLSNPDELDRLRANRDLMASAVEELLRYDSPVQLDGRTANTEVEVGGVLVAAGQDVITLLGAANRDPARYCHPDRLDIARDEGPSLSFAAGIHYCLGAALARMEAQVVLDALLDRYATIELSATAGEPTYKNSLTLRGLSALEVVLTP